MPWGVGGAAASGTCATSSCWSGAPRTTRGSSTSSISGWSTILEIWDASISHPPSLNRTRRQTRIESALTPTSHHLQWLAPRSFRFKEQFAIPHPTEAYAEIHSVVPEEYVGPVSRVMPIVQVNRTQHGTHHKALAIFGSILILPAWISIVALGFISV